MNNNKKLFLVGVVFVIISIFIIAIASFILSPSKSNNINNNIKNIKIYYYDKINNNISYEQRKIHLKKEDIVNVIFKEMQISPKSTNLKSTIPKDLSILNANITDYTLNINLSNNYNNLSNVEKLLFRSSFVWTITETPFVNNVKILVDGIEQKYSDNIEYLNRSNIILNPTISPDKIEKEKVVLYFANKNNKLVKEIRNIAVKQNKSMELHIVEELIKGSTSDDTIKVIPSETKIRNIKTEDNICYVDLSSDFMSKMYVNEKMQNLSIYSIVNSLTNLNNVNKVQFLINGEKINITNTNIDISQPLGRYKSIIENENTTGEDKKKG
ncbi:GerMN domain-containing protein [uncultured Tyzzerella sp.]|uniref:GerMN domain-containing protein n=1 Tax=uncultured Tyzzerella sp. TaxID=2321398 RepID=UPI0029430AD8|nr:GerMN domain-containing protein [uncultured Tyzzerella sp.]